MFGDEVAAGVAVGEALAVLRAVVARLEPDSLGPNEARELVELFVRVERVGAAGKALAARAADESYVWRRQGYASVAEWLAFISGSSVGAAIGELDTARQLDALPETSEAFKRGELSKEQTREVASGATADASAESELLDTAKRKPLKDLKEKAERVRAKARPEDVEARQARIHRARYLRQWTDHEGASMGQWRLTAEVGRQLAALIEAEAARVFHAARAANVVRESSEAYAADALVNLVVGDGRHRPKANVHVRVDAEAYRRGHARPGERCDVDGIPVPVRVARSMAADGTVDVHLVDGADVVGIQRLGAHIPRVLRDAVWEREEGRCRVHGCGARRNLEVDHIVARHKGGATCLDNLQLLCAFHHRQKSAAETTNRAQERRGETSGTDPPDPVSTGPPDSLF